MMTVKEVIAELQKLDPELEVWTFSGCSCYPLQPLEPDFRTKEVVDWVDRPPYSVMECIKKTVLIID